jgi:hypothetical protein
MIITPLCKLKLMSITQIIWNHTGILIMTTKLVYTKSRVSQLKAEQRLIERVTNILTQKRRNDAEDRAAQKAIDDE